MAGTRDYPVSLHGALAIACSVLLLSAGLLRGELIATVIGASLSLLVAFSFLTVSIAFFRWNWQSTGIESNESGDFRIFLRDTTTPPSRTLFVRLAYKIAFSNTEDLSGPYSPVLFPIPEAFRWIQPAMPSRGTYLSQYSQIIITDSLALFRIATVRHVSTGHIVLNVPPVPAALDFAEIIPSESGQIEGKSTFLRSDELYEVRQYHPGDDPRRVNWKVYAHTGEPALREGELLPPPASEYAIRFWVPAPGIKKSGFPARKDDRKHPDQFEELVSRAATVCLTLLSEGKNLRFPHAGDIVVRHDDLHARKKAIEALSRPSYPIAQAPECPTTQEETAHTILFVMPERIQPGTGKLNKLPLEHESRYSLVCIGPTVPETGKKTRLSLRGLLFESDAALHREIGIPQAETELIANQLRLEGLNAVTI